MPSRKSSVCAVRVIAIFVMACVTLSGCSGYMGEQANDRGQFSEPDAYEYDYTIGPGDDLQIFVWRNPELSQSATVRPDGKISSPLVEDMVASGKTSTQLARDIENVLSKYVRDPRVTVIVSAFQGIYEEKIRVVGEATKPQALPYRAGMTLLDVMIDVGGLTQFAAGNRAKIIRTIGGQQREITARLEDLIIDGNIRANVRMAPGDILIIPQAWF